MNDLSATPIIDSVTLASDLSNSTAFLQGLFASGVRSPDGVFANQSNSRNFPLSDTESVEIYVSPFCDEASIDVMIAAFYAAWADKTQGHLQDSDFQLIGALADYVEENCDLLWLPKLHFVGNTAGDNGGTPDTPTIFSMNDYYRIALKQNDGTWSEAGVKLFLTLFLFGAHHVFVQQPLYGSAPGFDDFIHTMIDDGLAFRDCDDSHYVGNPPAKGHCFVTTVTGDSVPENAALLNSFLMGKTVQQGESRDCFFQLEGWPAFARLTDTIFNAINAAWKAGLAGVAYEVIEAVFTWHMADYASYKKTLWNYSTFGASAYSEKRGTTVFLSQDGWYARNWPSTIMAPYKGATPLQPWLDTGVIQITAYDQPNPIASVVSQGFYWANASQPFQFDPSLSQGGSLTVAVTDHPSSASIAFDISNSKTGAAVAAGLKDGAKIAASTFSSDDDAYYYISSPTGADDQPFVVTLEFPSTVPVATPAG